MSEFWMQSAGGRAIDLVEPDPAEIRFEDIAHQLSQINRYLGATLLPYSVAQHCVLVSVALEKAGHDRWVCLAGLVHDAAEAGTGDIPAPVKKRLESLSPGIIKLLEEPLERTIAAMVGAPYPWPDAVKVADYRMLATEKRDLIGSAEPRPWNIKAEPYDFSIVPWDRVVAKREWLARFEELAK